MVECFPCIRGNNCGQRVACCACGRPFKPAVPYALWDGSDGMYCDDCAEQVDPALFAAHEALNRWGMAEEDGFVVQVLLAVAESSREDIDRLIATWRKRADVEEAERGAGWYEARAAEAEEVEGKEVDARIAAEAADQSLQKYREARRKASRF